MGYLLRLPAPDPSAEPRASGDGVIWGQAIRRKRMRLAEVGEDEEAWEVDGGGRGEGRRKGEQEARGDEEEEGEKGKDRMGAMGRVGGGRGRGGGGPDPPSNTLSGELVVRLSISMPTHAGGTIRSLGQQ